MGVHVFAFVDYILFGLTLSISACIGVYFGFCGNKQKSATEYLYGNRNMKAIPVGLSLYSSAISAVTIVGTPSEVYVFGTQYMLTALGSLLSLCVTWTLVLPVFCGNLEIATPYEYFQLRFNNIVRVTSSVIYVIHTLLYMPVVLYATTASLSEASNIPLVYCTTVVGGVCVFYTVLGGFKSVVWTDTIQATLMLCSCIFVMAFGFIKLGGFGEVWQKANNGQRINFFNMDPNPFVRITFWSASLGLAANFASHCGCSAGALQRYMALGSEKEARISTAIGAAGYSVIGIVCGLTGLCIYTYYELCDPVKNKEISGPNVILSHFVKDLVGHIPGFTGFFIAGLLCAGLSTISAELNTVGGVIYHDLILKIFNWKQLSETRGTFIMKIVVLVNGLFYLITAPLLENAIYLFQLSQILAGFTYGAKLGLVILGTTFPKANSIGALSGAVVSVLIMAWISIGGMSYGVGGSYALPVSITNCTTNTTSHGNSTIELPKRSLPTEEPLLIYKLSFMYYTFFGTIITIVVGLVVSCITGFNDDSRVDARLVIPRLRGNKQNNSYRDPTQDKLCIELQPIKT